MKEYKINIKTIDNNDYFIDADSVEDAMVLAMDYFIDDDDEITCINIQEIDTTEELIDEIFN